MISFLVNLLKKKILFGRNRAIIFRKIKEPLREWIAFALTEKLGLKINLVTRREIFNSDKYHVIQFGVEDKIVVKEPYNSSAELGLPWSISSTIGTFNLAKPFVLEVKNAEIIGSSTVGFDEDGSLISETIIGTPTSSIISKFPTKDLILKYLPSGNSQIDTAYSLINPWSSGYFHWMIDCLTRLEGVEYYQKTTGIKPALIINANPPNWKIDSLKLLGYEVNDLIQWNRSRIKVKRLVVPSFRREYNIISPTGCKWLRDRILSNLPDDGSNNCSFSSRVYISRPKTVGRNVINEDDVMSALAPFGFVAYTLENMSFLDEVRLFSQAEIVVAPHGAGLTNIIFAQNTNLIVIDIFGSYGTPCFFILAQALGFHYACLGSNNNGRNNRSEKYNGMLVDVPKLQALVAEMLQVYSDTQPVNAA